MAIAVLERWPHQARCLGEVLAAIAEGRRRVLVTSPTGGGKTIIMSDLARHFLDQGKKVVLYTNRKMLVDQTSEVLLGHGLYHGIRAAGYEDERDHNFQVSSIQTENSRVLKRQRWQLHDAELVLIDEAHSQTAATAQEILQRHWEKGAAYVGFTATPLGLASLYDVLIRAGTTSELRECRALVAAEHYGPDEPDLRKIKRVPLGEDLSEAQQRKVMMVPGIFGRVLSWYNRLNPERTPAILFAPGVKESIWFAERFVEAGYTAAHIDGQDVWVNGRVERTSRQAREDVLGGSRDGNIEVVCNRFVLREGIDAPWLTHGILATVFGSLQSYLQAGGRLLRAYPGLDVVTIQDHGGNWWRHGSLNADREWRLEYTSAIVAGLREERFRAKQEREPCRCPPCSRIIKGQRCPCGYEVPPSKRSRPVFQADGSYKEMTGDIYRPRRLTRNPNAEAIWKRMYFRSLKTDRTFRGAEALFAMENNWGWPPRDLPLMPTEPLDWFRAVKDVPKERLR